MVENGDFRFFFDIASERFSLLSLAMSNESGVVENGDFRFFHSLCLRIFTSKATFIVLCYVAHYWLFNDTEIDDLE